MSTTKQEFGIENKLEKGLARKVDTLDQLVHPIEVSEKNFAKNTEKAFADNLRKMQGMHAPLRLHMEKRAVAQVGHLPCVTNRSNFQMDILEGKDDMLSFENVLGQPQNFEGITNPHDVIEKRLGQFDKL